jgi:hypothetical protein
MARHFDETCIQNHAVNAVGADALSGPFVRRSFVTIITYPTDAEAKRDIVEAGRRLYQRGYVAANDGNLSARVSADTLWATPSACPRVS